MQTVLCLPSKACCTLRFKDCVLVALAEDGPPVDGGLEVRLINMSVCRVVCGGVCCEACWTADPKS